ncbi:MAG TPA: hypothetical protein VN612_12750 [Acidobacteriaceae bacterium]|nr:hypothetical protein [Acidobacteriaceae bacterium]
MISARNFYRNLGLTIGSLWLISVGGAFAAWSLIAVRSVLAYSLLVFLGIAAGTLLTTGVRLIVSSRRLLRGVAADAVQRRRLSFRFGLVVAAEVVACNVVSMMCLRAHRWELIVPLTLIVVGLHFLPLARLFHVPRYNVTGVLFCLIPAATLVAFSPAAHLGHALSWVAIPEIGCGLAALITGAAGLDEVQQFLNRSTVSMGWRSATRSA